MTRRPACALLALLAAAASADAQWLRHPTQGIPRTASGDVDLAAGAPRTADGKPDLSGVWGWAPGEHIATVATRLKPEDIKLWARELQKQRSETLGRRRPGAVRLLATGPAHEPIRADRGEDCSDAGTDADPVVFMGAVPMVPVAQHIFVGPFGRIEFVSDANGVVTHLLVRAAEGDLKAKRVATK